MNIIVWMQPQSNLYLCPGFCKEDWSVLVCQRQPIRVPGNLCVQLDLDGPASLLIWTDKKRDECLQSDGGKTVIEKFRCGGPGLVFRGTAEKFSPAKHVGLKQKEKPEFWTWFPERAELDFWNTMHWSICTTVVCCRFLVFSFRSVKMKVFGFNVSLRTDIHTEAGQRRLIQTVEV